MKSWLLFLLGTLAYFLIRYSNRTDKVKDFNVKFWLKDNWPELALTFILDLIAMILLLDQDTNITEFLSKYLPMGLVVSSKLIGAAACGLGIGYGGYEFVKRKIKKAK